MFSMNNRDLKNPRQTELISTNLLLENRPDSNPFPVKGHWGFFHLEGTKPRGSTIIWLVKH